MIAIWRAFIEFVVIGLIGVGLGFGVNAVRAKGSIEATKNYFDKGVPANPAGSRTAKQSPVTQVEKEAGPASDVAAPAPPSQTEPAAPTTGSEPPSDTDRPAAKAHPKHDYQAIEFDEVAAIFNDPATRQGLNLFVDARDDDPFAEGRIPGAVQCYPYEMQRFLDTVLQRAGGVEKVIVYCNGGECEDSIFTCRELIEAGVAYDAVYLFEGGWEEWTVNNMPVESDR